METVTGRIDAQVAARVTRYIGSLLIVLVSAFCGFVIGGAASTVQITH
ncbi:hypothetical protein [Streptomyces sp. AM 2-1-1]|nr:hypothetical protein [Streptomyces sp. AM 2-1-1]WEH41118.1 hypothetical protein PZB77_17335 [Streptomyces sp. AM 2-1-1]